MKKFLLPTLLFFSVLITKAQSLQDTKDFIKEIVDNNEPLENYDKIMYLSVRLRINQKEQE